MALALPTAHALAEVMPQSSSNLDCRITVSTEPRSLSLARHRDARILNESKSNLSQAESDDDTPLSPITFMHNEDYNRSRLSYMPPPFPRPASSPSSPSSLQSLSPVSPIMFTQPNLSSPSLAWTPPPVFPSPGTQSLALRLKRPLPPLPKVDTYDSPATEDVDTISRPARSASHGWSRHSPSSSDSRDNDSFNFSPATASQSPATSVASSPSDSSGSVKAVEAFHTLDSRPRVAPLIIPARSQSHPLPHPPIGQPIIQPYISVTPASPGPPQSFPYLSTGALWEKKRTASTTSIVLPSPYPDEDPAPEPERERERAHRRESPRDEPPLPELPRSASPAPSLAPSVASSRSFTLGGKMTLPLRRIASKTRLFGRRTLSSASEPPNSWDPDDDEGEGEETVVGHAHTSFDDKLLRPAERARSESPAMGTGTGTATATDDHCQLQGARCVRGGRVEVVEATLTPQGDIWETRDLSDVIPKLRRLRLKM